MNAIDWLLERLFDDRPGEARIASFAKPFGHPIDTIGELSDVSILTPVSGQLLAYSDSNKWENVNPPEGVGDVIGPGSATNNAIARYNEASGKLLQNSPVFITDEGDINIPTGRTFQINGDPLQAADVGAEPTLVKGDLLATGPLVFSETRQVVGGEAILSLPKATSSVDGYLDDADWSSFNAKADYLFGSNSFTGTGDFSSTGTGSFSTVSASDGLILPKTSGKGVRVDVASPTFPWRDIIGDVTPKTIGANAAVQSALIGGSYRAWFYDPGDINDMVFHMPHDYAPGTDLYIHLHWTHNGTAISGNLVVTFGITYAKGHDQASFTAEVAPVLSVSTPNITSVPRYRHRIDEIQISASGGAAGKLNSDLLEVDGLILVGLTTTTVPTITGGSPNLPAFLTLDLHYQSTNIGTKQKAPPFWT